MKQLPQLKGCYYFFESLEIGEKFICEVFLPGDVMAAAECAACRIEHLGDGIFQLAQRYEIVEKIE